MFTRLIFSAWFALLPAAALAQAAPAKRNTVTAGETAPSDRARQWLALVDDRNYAQSWKDAGGDLKKRAADAWAKAVLAMRDPLGSVANRSLKSVDVSSSQTAVVRFDTAFARKAAAVETITLIFENGGWVVADYVIN